MSDSGQVQELEARHVLQTYKRQPVVLTRGEGTRLFDADGRAISLEEKPENPSSDFAVPGLYFYDGQVAEAAAQLRPSSRGELEITDLNRAYLDQGKLAVEKMGRGIAWLDTGTHESLLAASTFISVIEERQGLKIACLEEIAYRLGYIGSEELERMATEMGSANRYGTYLRRILAESKEG